MMNKSERETLIRRLQFEESVIRALKDDQRTDIQDLYASGKSIKDISEIYKMKEYSVYMMLWTPVNNGEFYIEVAGK